SRPEPVPTRSFATPTATGKPARTPLQNRIEQLRRNRREAERRIPLGDRKLLYRELPKLVNEVKPLLVSAKRIGLEIEDGKRIINDAIQAGKGRDLEREVRAMGMDLRDPERLLRQGRESLDRRDVAGALRFGEQAQERMKRDVPAFVQDQMRKARNDLLDLKMRGNDLSRPIGILKDASALVKQGAWGDALRQIRE